MILDTQINTITVDSQGYPSVTTLTNGGFVVCWTSVGQDGSGAGVYAQRFNANGVAQGSEFRVNTYTIGAQFAYEITALNDGGFVVSWISLGQDGDDFGIYAQRYDKNGIAQGSEFRVNTYTIGSQSYPEITALNDGGFVVSWISYDPRDPDGSGPGIYAQRFNANGVAEGSEFRVNTYTIGSEIIALNDGGFVVGWLSPYHDGSGYEIYARGYNENGVAQGSEFLVNTYDTHTIGFQIAPEITALNNGGFVVSWVSVYQDGSGWGIYAQRYDENGVAQGSEFRVNTYTIGSPMAPEITALNDGGFVVSWTSADEQDGSQGVYAQRFNANGVAQGSEFHVNTYTNGSQYYSAITALNDGGFVISWASLDQDGDGSGIFAHRYNATGNEVGWTAADRLFNWAENIFSDLFPNHPESMEILGYHARIYENGNALGEQNDNIYFYDSHSIIFVGTVNDYLPDAIAAGF